MSEVANLKTIETLDRSPFKYMVATIGNLPTSFVDSMSYYECIAWLVKYLETEVIPTVNNNAEAVAELQAAYIQLKEFVDNYFENLDVQEEINNKLDQMAEDGTLLDIFKKYMATAGILTYSTVYDLSQADNVVDGSRVKTYGYKRLGDGVYDLYIVREKTEQDEVDGYNIVQLADETLVAEREQTGEKLVINLISTDNVQDYLNLTAEKHIILPYNTTVETSNSLFINSNTTLDLNNSTLSYTGNSEVLALAYRGDDTFTKYNGYHNITIENGTLKGGCLLFMHNQDVLIKGVNFDEINNSRHNMQIASCKNFTVTGCTFNGTKIEVETASECINIDPCNYGSQPWLASDSPMLDHNPNSNIVIENNEFKNPSDTTSHRYASAIGSHSRDNGYPLMCVGLVIRNNDFGSPYYSCINICDIHNVDISNNQATFDPLNSYTSTFFVRQVFGIENININNNNIKECTSFYTSESQDATRKNITIVSNTVTTNDTASNATLDLIACENVTIANNTFDVEGAFYRSNWRNGISNTCKNVKLLNNIINKHNAGLATVLRIYNTENSLYANNTLKYSGVTPESGYYFITIAGTTTGNQYYHNESEYPQYFAANITLTNEFSYNNGRYSLTQGYGDVTSGSGTLAITLDKLSVLRLQIGSSSNMQFAEVYPYLEDGRKFTTSDKTWRIPVVKSDGTFGSIQLSVTNSGQDFSWTGDVPLRQIFGMD